MFRLFLSIIFSFFLLFQTISIAYESNETNIEEPKTQTGESELTEEIESTEQATQQEEVEADEEPSEAEKEAQEAEAAEIREAGGLD